MNDKTINKDIKRYFLIFVSIFCISKKKVCLVFLHKKKIETNFVQEGGQHHKNFQKTYSHKHNRFPNLSSYKDDDDL